MSSARIPQLVLRIGIAFAFLYPPLSALFDPVAWLSYFPAWMLGYVPDAVLLHSFGVLEVVLGIWILSGWRVFLPSVVATLILVAVVLIDLYNFDVLFRDLSIAAAGLALAIMTYGHTAPHLSGQRDRH